MIDSLFNFTIYNSNGELITVLRGNYVITSGNSTSGLHEIFLKSEKSKHIPDILVSLIPNTFMVLISKVE